VYVVIVYDVNVERLDRVRIFLKQYLTWMQNSVLEGEITTGKLKEVEVGLKEIIDESEDSVIVYSVRDESLLARKFIGKPKVEPETII
jgi:CRISPR-associated protein Cas2